MSFTCELSGTVPSEAVVTTGNVCQSLRHAHLPDGHIFEKRLIYEHLEKSPTCPITGKALQKKDLIDIKQPGVKRPSSVFGGDVGSLLEALQAQFDSVNIENYRLLKERDTMRQQITQLLYLRDGSTRAVALRLEEIDLLKSKIQQLETTMASDRPRKKVRSQDEEVSPESFASTTAIWSELVQMLLQARRQRVIQSHTPEELSAFQSSEELAFDHPGASCFEILISSSTPDQQKAPHIIAYGTDSGEIILRDCSRQKPLATLKGHEASVTCLAGLLYPSGTHLAPSALGVLKASSSSPAPFKSCLNLLSGGNDGTVRLWVENTMQKMEDIQFLIEQQTVRGGSRYSDLSSSLPDALDFSCEHVFRLESGPISGIKMHPSGTHFSVTHQSAGWTLLDISSCCIAHRFLAENVHVREFYPCARHSKFQLVDLAFQPDGKVVVGAQARSIPVWDIRTQDLKAMPKVPESITGSLRSVNFSEIGYQIITTTSCGKGLVWDLRKSEVVQEMDLHKPGNIAKFDHSGKHIAVATEQGLDIWTTSLKDKKKKFDLVKTWAEQDEILDVQFEHTSDDYFMSLSKNGKFQCFMATI